MKLQSVHHVAYKCADPEDTRAFYEDVLGLPMVLTVDLTRKPSTGEPEAHYFHFFFELADGSCIAFFDLSDGEMPLPSPNVPIWTNHLAIRAGSVDELHEWRRRLEAAGVTVDAEIDHHFCRSIYFYDPNRVRLEITVDTPGGDFAEQSREDARRAFDDWLERRVRQNPALAN